MPARPSGLTLCSATLKTFPFKPSANSYVQASRELDLLCSHEGNHHGSYRELQWCSRILYALKLCHCCEVSCTIRSKQERRLLILPLCCHVIGHQVEQ